MAVLSLLVVLGISLSAGDRFMAGISAIGLISSAALAGSRFLGTRTGRAKLDRKRLGWDTAQPEIQRQNLNLEVLELAKVLGAGPEQTSDLQSAYIVAEDLALRQIQHDENAPLHRHVTIGNTSFEAVMMKGETVVCIEVAFLVVPDIRQEKIDAIMRKISVVKKTFVDSGVAMKVRLMMVLVTQLTVEDDDRLRTALGKQRFEETPVDIDIRLLDFESLQKIYVTD